ncbi:C4-dicarboxylate ABC transporter [Streptomyces sp. NPDC007088]|uniref:SLAC1 family transporter n=1 Tax=Streptomyces sp. NPDC007088 TaxID=3364773 RepID=UPI0036A332BB
MTVLAPPRAGTVPPPSAPASRLGELGPHHYAAVMGTAILSTAGASLPVGVPGLGGLCEGLWALSVLTLLVLLAARALFWSRYPGRAREALRDPATAPFYGCLPMAFLAVGAATLHAGRAVLGAQVSTAVAWALFVVGTVLGLVVAVGVPLLMAVGGTARIADVSPVWLLPLVCPMVSASLGPQLAPHLSSVPARATLLYGCLALFGMSLLATLALLPLIVGRLLAGGPWPLALTPSLFLVLGPLGQSTTAAGAFGSVARGALPAPFAAGFTAFGVLYGVPVLGFALLWLALAGALVARALRRGLRPAPTWWAFTFPVGTCVTGATGLAGLTGLEVYRWGAAALYAFLVVAWCAAVLGTLRPLVRGGGATPAPGGARPDRARARTT